MTRPSIDKYSETKKSKKLKIVTSGDLLTLSKNTIDMIKCEIQGRVKIITTKEPRDYQEQAINKVVTGLKTFDRGQIILPCGTGKTIISLWIMETLNISHTIVLVPSLAILRQTKSEWSANRKCYIPYICVCSEGDIDASYDNPVTRLFEISGPVTTNPNEIRLFLHNNVKTITYSTYQSLPAIKEALKSSDFMYDLAICDEAHKTAGGDLKEFGLIHSNANIHVKKRIYMTATPRVISSKAKNKLDDEQLEYIYDMSNIKIFGPELYRMSYREAIERDILVDYKIVAVGIDNIELHEAIKQRRYVSHNETIDEIANNYSLEYIMEKHNLSHAITFHSTIKLAKQFADRHQSLFNDIDVFHVNGKLTTNDRNKILGEFDQSRKSIITNSRCLMEGINKPIIDTIFFCDPKYSSIDIVQATGRALRKDDNRNKLFGYIIVPIFHPSKLKLNKTIDSSPFKNLINVVRALSSHDERITDEINLIKLGKGVRSNNTNIPSLVNSCKFISIEGFTQDLKAALFDQIIDRIRLPWKTFLEARLFCHSLKLKSGREWREYCLSEAKPEDIPRTPDKIYKNKGWVSWGDWLGTGNIAPQNMLYLPFIDARKFVHTLKLSGQSEWRSYCKSAKPDDIPSTPEGVYKKQWTSWGDWLGTGTIANFNKKYLLFSEAKSFIAILNMKSIADWKKYCKSGNKPIDIPSSPNAVYKDSGWISWGDWLGTNVVANKNRIYQSFEDARAFIHTLHIKNQGEWNKYCKDGCKPADIPSNPSKIYRQEWTSWGDWLGTGRVHRKHTSYLPFEKARAYVKSLKLKNNAAWLQYCKSGNKPADIPSSPSSTYKNNGWISLVDWLGTEKMLKSYEEGKAIIRDLHLKNKNEWAVYSKSGKKPIDIPANPYSAYKNNGWISWGDWLGTGTISPRDISFLPFELARSYIHKLKINNYANWKKYCKSGNKPIDIPSNPYGVYKDDGWISWGDWLGTGVIAPQKMSYLPFSDARKYIHSLGLKTSHEWTEYLKSGEKPIDIPSDPRGVYKEAGWRSMGDWLGTKNVAPQNMKFRSFEDARRYVQQLKLKNLADWKRYCKSGNKPHDIPFKPSRTYNDKGWKSLGDWLGTGNIAPRNMIYRRFNYARKFVHLLQLKSGDEWRNYCKSANKPSDIPASPSRVYKNEGWKSMGDWLGTGSIAPKDMIFRSFVVNLHPN